MRNYRTRLAGSLSTSVPGLAFHPTQPLLAASLHNGSVQLWNYRMGVLVDRFEEHEGACSYPAMYSGDQRPVGPVRAVAFHPSRALLATGGDDYKIKVWGEYELLDSSCVSPNYPQISDPQTVAASSRFTDISTTSVPSNSIMRCHGL